MVFQNDILAGASGAGGGYTIDQSIRFNDDDSAYLSRTSGSADSERKFASVSMWLKRSNLTSRQNFYSVNSAGSNGASNQISMAFENSGTNGDSITYNNGAVNRQSTSVYRDVSGWYHFVQIFDTTQATAADRVKTYINGVLLTDLNIGQDFSLNSNTPFGQSGVLHYIGRRDSGFYYDGYMAEIVFTVGQSVAVTDFGETNNDGVWVPKAYAGTYGTNGFYITGEDSADLGADFSGNGNDFTSSGLTSDDQVTDTPTDNYATLNPLNTVAPIVLSNGNLSGTYGGGAYQTATSGTISVNSGKWYWEVTVATVGASFIGLALADIRILGLEGTNTTFDSGDAWVYGNDSLKYNGFTGVGYGASYTSGDVIGVAFDADAGSLTFYKNNSSQGVAYTGLTSGPYMFIDFLYSGAVHNVNFGQLGFTYTPPTGFSALSTANLPGPAIADGSAYFQATTYTGAGYPTEVNQSGNSTFQPDFVWVKRRNGATTHDLFDAVRGVSSQLYSNLTNAEGAVSNAISFDADGFTAAADPITGDTGSSSNTFVGWQWLAANGTASNSDGSITSTVSANTTAGFSIISYTGNATSGATIGHGLGVAPAMVITKSRDNGTGRNWAVYHAALGPTKYLELDNNNLANVGSTRWNDTAPSSTVITLGSQQTTNDSGAAMIAYAFAEVEGFSKFGSYTGNGSTDGPFIFTGFRPAFVMFKKTSGTDSWEIFDNTRPGYNATDLGLFPNATDSESTGRNIDILSNGIKQRNANGTTNESGYTYIFMAFAEHPFGGDGVAPVPAR
jgi:hypothetical protein